MEYNDLDIEDFKEIFIKSIVEGNTTSQEISDYFKIESDKFMIRFSDESCKQRLKDYIFKKFIEGVSNAFYYLSEYFIDPEQNCLWDMWELKGNGIDVSKIVLINRYDIKLLISDVCVKFEPCGYIELTQIEFINKGFELFKQNQD